MESLVTPGIAWFMIIFSSVFSILALCHIYVLSLEKNNNKAAFDKLKNLHAKANQMGASIYTLHLATGDAALVLQDYELALRQDKGVESFYERSYINNLLSEYQEEKQYSKYRLVSPEERMSQKLKKQKW